MLINIESRYHQTSGDERKKLKRATQKDEKATRSQTKWREPYKRDKHLGCDPRKILGAIFEVDQRRT